LYVESFKCLISYIPVFRIHRILWKLLIECDALRTLVQVLDNSSTENDGLRKYVPTSLKLLAAALEVPNPYHRTEGTHDHNDKYPDHSDEMDSESIIIPGNTKVS
jgi:hypothetical protein